MRVTSNEVLRAKAKLREDESCDDAFGELLGAVYAAAKALRDVPEAVVSLGAGLSEEQVEKFADALEAKVWRQVSLLDKAGPRLIYGFEGHYEAALTGGKHTVTIRGQGCRLATAAEAREYGVRLHDNAVRTLTGDEAAAQVKGGAR